MQISTFSTHSHTQFLFDHPIFPELLELQVRSLPVWPISEGTLGNCCGRTFTGRMPFLSPNQQHQSTEGWQCSWLGTTLCYHAVKVSNTVMVTWATLPSGFKAASLLWVFLTWKQHAATMLSWWTRNTFMAVLFTGRIPFLSPNQQRQLVF